ncbi:MAG: hypothetical protein OEV85_06910 [Candidatus Thorarchaeota archaeon]|nr:hypothetical protein [Candidatus Thorarchaeota archaeon]
MNDEGERVIEEYLLLVREKLPDSIADDVISELRSYMHESARDQGEGEITVQSAKKVVAQFGAPGEVADEYKYSMLPETIPDETVQPEIIRESQELVQHEPLQQAQPQLTPISQEDPTVSYFSFFLTTSVQSWIWILIASMLTFVVGPLGEPLWTLLIPICQAALVTCVLFFHSNNLKWNKIILWRRAYREWSALQNFVTLPENSIPEAGINVLRLDSLISFIGIVLFLIATLMGNSPFFIMFCGVPVCLLLGARIYYRLVTFRDDKDPIRNSRKQFIINLALLVGLNASVFWISYSSMYYYWSILSNLSPFLLPFIVGYGSVVLFNVVTGTQNLWWKTQDEPKTSSVREKEILREDKAELLACLPNTMGRLYLKIIGWIVVFNLPQIYVSFDHSSFDFVSSEFYNWISFLIVEIAVTGLLIVFYFPYRRFVINRLDSRSIFGRRTRIEATIDTLICSIFLVMILGFLLNNGIYNIVTYSIIDYQRHLGTRWSLILATMQIGAYPIGAIALITRIIGNIHEFRAVWKRRAISLVEQSGVLLFLAITAFAGVEYLRVIVYHHWFGGFIMMSAMIMPLIIFLAFQIGSSSLKGKMMKKHNHDKKGNSVKSRDVYSSIAN